MAAWLATVTLVSLARNSFGARTQEALHRRIGGVSTDIQLENETELASHIARQASGELSEAAMYESTTSSNFDPAHIENALAETVTKLPSRQRYQKIRDGKRESMKVLLGITGGICLFMACSCCCLRRSLSK
mmetsp:Transcript_72806/g.115225  ORF Transcript_72806/g.115225 Transcript_72806/m.115225 type:complete len:132 (+) Transcript_72806:79-474(+)